MIDLAEIFELGGHSVLMPSPCGCVIESSLKVDDGIITCPWCDAMFSAVEYGEWIHSGAAPKIFLGDGPKSMIRCPDGRLHEICGEQAGLPVARVGRALVRFSQFERIAN